MIFFFVKLIIINVISAKLLPHILEKPTFGKLNTNYIFY